MSRPRKPRAGRNLGTLIHGGEPFSVTSRNGVITFRRRYSRERDALKIELGILLRALMDQREANKGQVFFNLIHTP